MEAAKVAARKELIMERLIKDIWGAVFELCANAGYSSCETVSKLASMYGWM